MNTRISRRAIACALFASTSLIGLAATPAHAQVKRPMPDEHGIDVISGVPMIPSGRLTIGDPNQGGLEFHRVWQGGGWYHNLEGSVTANGSSYTVTVGSSVESFTLSGGVYQSDDGRGSTLTKAVNGFWTYTLADGTAIVFENPGTLRNAGIKGLLSSITNPDGLVTTFTNIYQGFCEFEGQTCGTPVEYFSRVQSVRTNTGYQMKFEYARGTTTTAQQAIFEANWLQLTKVTAINNAVDYCAPDADTCGSLTQSWPVATISVNAGGPGNFTDVWADALNNATTGTVANDSLTSIQSPADPSVDFSLTYDTSGRVASFAQGGGTWTYGYADNGTQRTTTVTQPLGGSKVYVSDTALRTLLSATDELGHTTSYQYDGFERPTRITSPEGNYAQLTYDARGNVTERRAVAKPGSGLADIVTTASFPASCVNPKTCNAPTSSTDANGNTTDFTYDSGHGGVLTVTAPAPISGAVRPQARYGYSALFAYYKNSSGVIAAAPSAITKPTSVSACQTQASCAGTADEVKSTIVYGSTGVANNLLPTTASSGSGNGTLTATTTRAYDQIGNLTSIDGPLSGTADTAGFRYDANRRLTMRVSPDPDGAGALKMRAQRLSYDADGNVSKIEAGTTTTLTGAFAPVASGERVELAYDSLGRKVKQSLVSETATTSAVNQFSYDAKGRPQCTALRMNPAAFGSLPASACTLGAVGTDGPDRIARTVYDNADQATQLQVAVGTTDAANERTLTYTANGMLATLKDAESNLTTYDHDAFDRLAKTRFPLPTKGANASSTTDYEQLGYDANGNVTSRRLRDGRSILFSYDALDRRTFMDVPPDAGVADVTYGYDNLGRLTSATEPGNTSSFLYDALGRQTTEFGGFGRIDRMFDLAGRLTRTTWWDGFYVQYDRLTTGELSKVRENGAASGVGVLATFGYDDQGRRTSLTFGNGVVQAYGYDAASRLASLTNDLSGTTNDLTATFAYNPASQIASATHSNDAYAFAKSVVSESGAANGLNQLTAYAGEALSHDARGNVTAIGARTLGYSAENLLTSASPGVTLYYDPLRRLAEYDTTVSTRFVYDGLNAVAEVDNPAGAIQHRYVWGDGPDELLVDYAGSAAGGRRFASTDERGSVIALSDSSGVLVAINAYDEFGRPAAGNVGRFGYTGQMWLSEIGAYNYKARMYDPATGGRFLQSDPVGYGDSPNLYAYVLNDPVNGTDPTGRDIGCTSRIANTCQRDEGSSAASGSGGGSLGGLGGGGGGAIDGPPCPDTGCMSPNDPREGDSLDYFGGYWLGNRWISTRYLGERRDYGPYTADVGIFQAKLSFLDKALAKTVYKRNPQIRQNIKNIVQSITGQTFTNSEIDRIMRDILNGQSTTISGLRALGQIGSGHFDPNPTQRNLINIYIRELPPSPLNNQIKRSWSTWRRVG